MRSYLDQNRLKRLYNFLEGSVRRKEISGASLRLSVGTEYSVPKAFGRFKPDDANKNMQPDSIFLVASITKPFTVAAAVLLAERGQLLLDDPACLYLPEFGTKGKEHITLRHLMTHSSGLPDMLPGNQSLRERLAEMSEFIEQIYNLNLDFPPGTGLQYQSTGLAILGEIVQRVSGLSLKKFLRQEFFEPLGMKDTELGAKGLPADRLSQIELTLEQEKTNWGWNSSYWRNLGAAWGGMFSTVEDLTRFLRMILNGGEFAGKQILSKGSVDAMIRDQTSPMPHISNEQKSTMQSGLGWRLAPSSCWGFFGDFLSPGSFGHGGATGTVFWADPNRDMTFVLLTTQPSIWSEPLLGKASNLAVACVN
jgi:CubicO group peptidase (beta-lactamase class C family)